MSNLDFFDMFNLYFGGAPASLVRPEGVASRPYGVKNSAAAKARAGREFPSPETPFLPAPPERQVLFLPRLRRGRNSAKNGGRAKIPGDITLLKPLPFCPPAFARFAGEPPILR